MHDYRLLKTLLPSKETFENLRVLIDLGFLGFMNDYLCKECQIPHKKSKKKPLTDEQLEENKQKASERIVVEHAIGGAKRYRILSERLRLHDLDLYDNILFACAGLWNLNLTIKSWF